MVSMWYIYMSFLYKEQLSYPFYNIFIITIPPTSLFVSATARVCRPPVREGGSGILLLRNGPINSLAQFQVVTFPKGVNGLLNDLLPILHCFCIELHPLLRYGPVQSPSTLCNRPLYCLFHISVLIRGHGSYRLLDGPQSTPLGLLGSSSEELI